MKPFVSLLVASLVAIPPLAAEQQVFRAAADSVNVNVSVLTGGRSATDLTARDFEVRDNGVVQTVLDVGRESVPIDVRLVIDLSGSLEGALYDSLRRAVDAVSHALAPEDRAGVMTFTHRIHEIAGLTTGRLPSTSLASPGGGTSLFDAITVSLISPPELDRRQMIIVFTDGNDTLSIRDAPAVEDTAARSEAAVFIVAVTDGTSAAPRIAPNGAFFHALADASGGEVDVLQRDQDLGASFVAALARFRASYVIRYQLKGVPPAGWHALSVRVTKSGRFDIRARKGYFGS